MEFSDYNFRFTSKFNTRDFTPSGTDTIIEYLYSAIGLDSI